MFNAFFGLEMSFCQNYAKSLINVISKSKSIRLLFKEIEFILNFELYRE